MDISSFRDNLNSIYIFVFVIKNFIKKNNPDEISVTGRSNKIVSECLFWDEYKKRQTRYQKLVAMVEDISLRLKVVAQCFYFCIRHIGYSFRNSELRSREVRRFGEKVLVCVGPLSGFGTDDLISSKYWSLDVIESIGRSDYDQIIAVGPLNGTSFQRFDSKIHECVLFARRKIKFFSNTHLSSISP